LSFSSFFQLWLALWAGF
jgi:hypothetical protein